VGEDYFQDLRSRLVEALSLQGLYGKLETLTNFGHPRTELPRTSYLVLNKIDRGQLPGELKSYMIEFAVREEVEEEIALSWVSSAYVDFFKSWCKAPTLYPTIGETEFKLDPTLNSKQILQRFESAILERPDANAIKDIYSQYVLADASLNIE